MRATFSLPIVATFSLAIATFAFMFRVTAPTHAQTYDPDYPVCMQVYGPVGYLDCRYASIEQCKFLAVGMSASCVTNPYFARKKSAPPRRLRRVD